MKQKAKIYKGKRIVIGDKNLVTKNEIHVNDIPQEGGESSGGNSGGEGGGSASSIEYLDVSGVNRYVKQTLLLFSLYSKVPQDIIIDTSEGGNQHTVTFDASIGPSANTSVTMGALGMSSVHTDTFLSGVTALGIDFSQKIVTQGQTMTINEFFTMSGGKEMIDAIPRITEEEFYTLN